MIPNAVETAKDAMLRTFAAQLRVEHPSWTFARSFAEAQSQHPELAEEFDEQPTSQPVYQPPLPGPAVAGSATGYRYKPARSNRVEAKDIDRSSWVRVEAGAGNDGGELFICYDADGEVIDLELI